MQARKSNARGVFGASNGVKSFDDNQIPWSDPGTQGMWSKAEGPEELARRRWFAWSMGPMHTNRRWLFTYAYGNRRGMVIGRNVPK